MGKRRYRRKIESLEARIRERREKIAGERQKETPDEGDECHHVLKLLAQLELPGLKAAQAEAVLGALSAAVLHLHEHTRGLDAIIDEDLGGTG